MAIHSSCSSDHEMVLLVEDSHPAQKLFCTLSLTSVVQQQCGETDQGAHHLVGLLINDDHRDMLAVMLGCLAHCGKCIIVAIKAAAR